MIKKYVLLLFIFSLCFVNVNGQERKVDNQFNSWWTLSGNHKVADKFSIHTVFSHRLSKFVKERQQTLLRLGVNYQIRKELTAMIGYDWVRTFRYGKQPIPKDVVEQRFISQLQLKQKIGRVGITQRYRFEQQFIDLGDNRFNRYRFRYLVALSVPLNNKKIEAKTFYLSFFNELFINVGNRTGSNYFNQNWTYLGLGYKIDKSKVVRLGYMNQYLPKANNELVESNHTMMINYSQNLDFRKKKKE